MSCLYMMGVLYRFVLVYLMDVCDAQNKKNDVRSVGALSSSEKGFNFMEIKWIWILREARNFDHGHMRSIKPNSGPFTINTNSNSWWTT
ncbi:4546_t:CDS:2 [Funneliformis mosseae]|uniref:4546_t:CDS:1 n=1 Tax=Funneliformis mosseae TaxID=27381 RepID=A0A9N8WE05_FUNMO|nr:4546_t:CDS:2 [Funneliformis mosseae]